MPNKSQIPEFEKMARELLEDAVTFAEVTGLNFFKESFDKQGWTDGAFVPWAPRSTGEDGRAILVKTANLLNSLRVIESSPLQIEFGTSEPYAQIHNEGGTITVRVTEKSRRYFWYMYKATGVEMWKGLALTKKETITMKIPKRQFIGESQTLMNTLDTWFKTELEKRFKKL